MLCNLYYLHLNTNNCNLNSNFLMVFAHDFPLGFPKLKTTTLVTSLPKKDLDESRIPSLLSFCTICQLS